MANNQYVNKVVYGSTTLVDLTGTTATADKILEGYGAYGADGAWMSGTAHEGGEVPVWQGSDDYVYLSDTAQAPIEIYVDENGYVVLDMEPAVLNLQSKTYTVDSAGTETITADSGYDGLSEVEVSVPTGSVAITTTGNFITINGTKYFRFSADAGIDSNNDMGTEGYISDHTIVSDYDDYSIVPSGTSVTPTESAQTIGGLRRMMEGAVTVNAIPSNYVGSSITRRSSTDLTASGATVTAPSGYYSSSATKTVASGSATPASSISATGATVSTGTNTLTLSKSVSNTPTVSAGYVSSGTAGNSSVSLTASINTRSSSDLSVSGATVTAPAGYYASAASKAVAAGTAGTPTATKGTVSNHAVTVTPSVTNTTGYITGSTKTGTGVSVSASELVSGTYSVTSSGTKDVTNYASASVPSGTEGTPIATKSAVINNSVTISPSVTNTTGYITGGTRTGSDILVRASELVSGTKSITSNGMGIDVTNYASVNVSVSGGGGIDCPIFTADNFGNISCNKTYNECDDYCVEGNHVAVLVDGITTLPLEASGVTALREDIYYYSSAEGVPDLAIAYSPNGTITPIWPSSVLDTLNVTSNGSYSAPSGKVYNTVNVSVSGGASNVITGTFTTSSTSGTTQYVTIPYSGSGYPIMAHVEIDGGVLSWDITSLPRRIVGQWVMSKEGWGTSPNYNAGGGEGTSLYTSGNGTLSQSKNQTYMFFSYPDPSNPDDIVVFSSATQLVTYVNNNGTNYGLNPSSTYRYCITYSS